MQGIFFNPPAEQFALGHQFGEVYKDRVYVPFLPLKKKGSVCVDIGANIGVTTYFFSQHFERVISVEPSKEHFSLLASMVNFNKLDNITLVNKGIFHKEGKFQLFHPSNKTAYTMNSVVERVAETPPENIETITIKTLFEKNNIDHVDLLKVDVEGVEFEILGSKDFKDVSDRIKTIILERHPTAGRNPSQLEDSLKLRGFKVNRIINDADILIATR